MDAPSSSFGRVNAALDALSVRAGKWLRAGRPVYPAAGLAGMVVGTTIAAFVARVQAVPVWPLPGFALTAVCVTLAVALATKVVTGEESLTLYRSQLCVFAAILVLLRWWELPLWVYLDLCVVAASITLACGRLGCLLVGCCHGVPARMGIRYTAAHAQDGFDGRFVGIRLLPVQALESALLLTIGGWCAVVVLRMEAPGMATLQYATLYAAGRFVLEHLRGDGGRRYAVGVSEACWTSVAVACAVGALGPWSGAPVQSWQVAAAGVPVVVLLVRLLAPQLRHPDFRPPLPAHRHRS